MCVITDGALAAFARKVFEMGQILFVEDEPNSKPRRSFFACQFAGERTRGQLYFDVFFGVIGPILCFAADPVVFTSNGIVGGPILGPYQLFAYLISAIAIAALVIWLCFERHLSDYGAAFGGVFLAGAAFSTVVGIAILPFSLLGLIVLIGLLGFAPFITAFVYLRNGIKAFRRASNVRTEWNATVGLVAGAVAIVLPVIVTYQISTTVSRSIQDLLSGDARQAQAAADRLRWIPLLPAGSLEPLVRAYSTEQDPRKKEVLKTYYKDATGQDIEYRLMILND